MKKVTFAAFVAFWAGLVVIVGVAQLAPDRATGDEDALPVITLEQLAEHDHDESCWMAIEGRVYDFTDYIPQHPTPPAIMLAWCGREATEGMRTKGYGRDHSPTAWAMMDDHLIGVLAGD
jgi:cytochrome b involved in lipid metabolism